MTPLQETDDHLNEAIAGVAAEIQWHLTAGVRPPPALYRAQERLLEARFWLSDTRSQKVGGS